MSQTVAEAYCLGFGEPVAVYSIQKSLTVHPLQAYRLLSTPLKFFL